MDFPRFHRHLPKWENADIGGQHEHEDTTVVYGDVSFKEDAVRLVRKSGHSVAQVARDLPDSSLTLRL